MDESLTDEEYDPESGKHAVGGKIKQSFRGLYDQLRGKAFCVIIPQLFTHSADSLDTPNESRLSTHLDASDRMEDQISAIHYDLEKETTKFSTLRSTLSQLREELDSVKKDHTGIVCKMYTAYVAYF